MKKILIPCVTSTLLFATGTPHEASFDEKIKSLHHLYDVESEPPLKETRDLKWVKEETQKQLNGDHVPIREKKVSYTLKGRFNVIKEIFKDKNTVFIASILTNDEGEMKMGKTIGCDSFEFQEELTLAHITFLSEHFDNDDYRERKIYINLNPMLKDGETIIHKLEDLGKLLEINRVKLHCLGSIVNHTTYLEHRFYFKVDSIRAITSSGKIGVFNTYLSLKEKNKKHFRTFLNFLQEETISFPDWIKEEIEKQIELRPRDKTIL